MENVYRTCLLISAGASVTSRKNVKKYINVICLPKEHHGAQRTRSNVAVHFQIELEFGNVGFRGEGKTRVPGEKPLGAE